MKLNCIGIKHRSRQFGEKGRSLKNLTLLVAGMVLSSGLTAAAPIDGLFNTGVDSSGVLLAGGPGTPDPHWTVLGGGSAKVAPNQPGFYLPQVSARFINTDGTSPQTTFFILQLQFDLTGYDHTTASFSGRFAADNCAVMQLNGNSATSGGEIGPCGALTAFGQYTGFSFSSGFLPGLNTISVQVTNIVDSPGAALVEFTSSSVERVSGSPVPEPATWGITAAALLALGGLRRLRC